VHRIAIREPSLLHQLRCIRRLLESDASVALMNLNAKVE
jgi:hypothetical protein